MPQSKTPPWLEPLRELTRELGFSRFGVSPAVKMSGFNQLVNWIDQGYAAGMQYFADRLDAYRHPDGVMPGTKSVIVLTYPYPADNHVTDGDNAKVARYAWPGTDYHDEIHRRFKQIRRWMADHAAGVAFRGCVDTAPLLERELAQRAGLGWRGKNTMLINRNIGSYFFLACIMVDVELPYDTPDDHSYCGSCTACLDACPTAAFPEPGVLDANRCISYLTIEHRGEIPEEQRTGIEDWIFGCDVCQEVCPWNRKPMRNAKSSPQQTVLQSIDPQSVLMMDEETFRATYRKTPFWRTRLQGLKRNAAIVLGNIGDESALETLRQVEKESDECISESCRWAIRQIHTRCQV